jgi:hypothetical protein
LLVCCITRLFFFLLNSVVFDNPASMMGMVVSAPLYQSGAVDCAQLLFFPRRGVLKWW